MLFMRKHYPEYRTSYLTGIAREAFKRLLKGSPGSALNICKTALQTLEHSP
jgi:hypothetical protein